MIMLQTLSGSLQAILFISSCFSYSEQSARIVGGQDTTAGQFPFMVGVKVDDNGFLCGGSIVNENYILTGAHCVLDDQRLYQIKAGLNDRKNEGDQVQTIDVDQIIKHEDYVLPDPPSLAPNDIALLHLSTPLTLNDLVQVVQLPEPGSEPSGDATLVGWGDTSRTKDTNFPDILQFVNQPVVDFATCQPYYGKLLVQENMICAGPEDDSSSACYGDSGGPLIQNGEKGPVQIGITAGIAAYPCGKGPSAYTKVSKFVDWINGKMNG